MIRIDRAVEQRLDRLVERTGRTKAYFLHELIVSELEDLEDYHLASATMENVRKGKEKVYPARDVRKGLGPDERQSPKASLRGLKPLVFGGAFRHD